jgi:nucleotide-binding universal stress UspA family protein
LLVGFDGSDGGRDALELARLLATEADGSVTIATVLFSGPLPINLAGLDDEEAREAEPIFAEARTILGDLVVEAHAFGGGSAGAILTGLAERDEFDAIVVGSPHHGAVGRVLIGSVGGSLLSGAPCDVVVAPKHYAVERHDALRTIAVGYDGTPESELALRRAEELARPDNAMLKVLTVVAPPVVISGMTGYTPVPPPPEPDGILNKALESVDPKLGAQGQRLDGAPASALAKACENGVDLLVLGSRGYGPLSRVLVGSVSRKAAHESPCPVWVVPRPRKAEPA